MLTSPLFSVLLVGLLLTAGCAGPATPQDAGTMDRPAMMQQQLQADHQAALAVWRTKRLERLTAEDGYLTLVGLPWLETGVSTFGADPAGDLVCAAVPVPHLGTFTVPEGNEPVTFRASGAMPVSCAGVTVDVVSLIDDRDGAPTVLATGTLRFHLIRRGSRLGVRIKDSQAETRVRFPGLVSFPDDPAWRIVARYEPRAEPLTITSIIGVTEDEPSAGTVAFEYAGRTHRLHAVPTGDDGALFFVFADATNGTETYGGGRFLVADAPDAQARVVLDFNRAHNPACAFTPYATCPLPPEVNRLPFAVPAGEMTPRGAAQH